MLKALEEAQPDLAIYNGREMREVSAGDDMDAAPFHEAVVEAFDKAIGGNHPRGAQAGSTRADLAAGTA